MVASRQDSPGAGKARGFERDRREGRRPTPPRSRGAAPPRDPGAYARTDHFRERVLQPGRYVSEPVAADVLRSGQLRWNTSDGWRFALVRGGIRFVLVVGDVDTPSPVLVTGWTEVADWRTAIESDRWTETDVHTIQLRADLSEAPRRAIPGRIRPLAVDRPFALAGHRVGTAPGAGHVACCECGRRFRSKAELARRPCRG